MQWWEIYVQVPEPMSEVVGAYLHQLGSTSLVIHDHAVLSPPESPLITTGASHMGWTVLQGAFETALELPDEIGALQTFLQQLSGHDGPVATKLYYCPLPNDDYTTQWQDFFRPLTVAQRLYIRPPWDSTSAPDHMAILTLEPGLAFGTGTHPTTYLCLVLLTQYLTGNPSGDERAPKQLLDVGCGSGILSLAGLMLGVQTALGVDVDPQAIEVAQSNAAYNGLQARVQFLLGSWDMTTDRFDVITANIFLGPLIEMMAPLTQRLVPDGTLILSGILESQVAALEEAIQSVHLRIHRRLAEDGWAALAVQRIRT